MFAWIMAGYCLAAVVFYGFLVATAQPDPYDDATQAVNEDEHNRQPTIRKAA